AVVLGESRLPVDGRVSHALTLAPVYLGMFPRKEVSCGARSRPAYGTYSICLQMTIIIARSWVFSQFVEIANESQSPVFGHLRQIAWVGYAGGGCGCWRVSRCPGCRRETSSSARNWGDRIDEARYSAVRQDKRWAGSEGPHAHEP